MLDAGAYEPFAGGYRALRSVWTAGDSFTVKLERPLQAGDIAYAETSALVGDTEVRSYRGVPVLECPFEPTPVIPTPVAPPPPAPPAPSPTPPTAGQMAQAVKGSVGATRLQPAPAAAAAAGEAPEPRCCRSRSLSPGRSSWTSWPRARPIGTGTKSSTANGKFDVSIKLTPAGRKLFKRTKKTLKVTLKGTFTPSRTGQGALNAGVTVTLKR